MTGVELFTLFAGTTAATTVTLGSALTAAGTAASAIGAVKSLNAQANAADFNADLAMMQGQAEATRRRRESQRRLGTIRVGRAKSGVTGEGTPLLVLAESAENAELDALNAIWQGGSSAQLSSQRARSARDAKPFAIGTSLLTGTSQLTSRRIT